MENDVARTVEIVISTTFNRLKRMQELLDQNIGRIDVKMSKRFLSDDSGFPNSICVHGCECAPQLKTLSAMVFDLQDKKTHNAFGNACETPYNEYTFS